MTVPTILHAAAHAENASPVNPAALEGTIRNHLIPAFALSPSKTSAGRDPGLLPAHAAQRRSRRGALSPATVLQHHSILRCALARAVRWDCWPPTRPIAPIRPVSKPIASACWTRRRHDPPASPAGAIGVHADTRRRRHGHAQGRDPGAALERGRSRARGTGCRALARADAARPVFRRPRRAARPPQDRAARVPCAGAAGSSEHPPAPHCPVTHDAQDPRAPLRQNTAWSSPRDAGRGARLVQRRVRRS